MSVKIVCPKCGATFYTAGPVTKCIVCGASLSGMGQALTLEGISEKITQLLNEINLYFVPKTKEEDEVIREVRRHLVDAGTTIVKYLEKR
jgi:hypothetical protein